MRVKKILIVVGKVLAAFVVLAMFLLYGLIIYFFKGPTIFRLGFYLPVLCIVAYLYLGKKKRGLFLETLAFVLTLMLAMVITIDLIAV